MVDSALKLVKAGKSVIPVSRTTKMPLVSWKGYQEQTPTEEQVKEWWTQFPDANLGMVTGHLSGLVVIDCDSEGAANRFIEEYPEAKDTLQVQTGRGKHYYFQYEEGIRNDVGKLLGTEIDIRGEGGFVILPPSIHSAGKAYEWLNKNKPIPLPTKLREVLLSRLKSTPANGSSNPEIAERIPQGQRNATLTSLAGTMRHRGMSEEAIRAALLVENSQKCDPPLREAEVEEIARSVARYEPGSALPTSRLYTPTESEEVKTPLIWAKDVPPPNEGEEIQTLWGSFLFPSSLHLLAGDAGLGKTTLMYNISICLARGSDFGGFKPPRRLRVLYFDLETPDLLFRRKLHLISENSPPEGLAFNRSFSVSEALALTKEHHFDLIIMDTLNEAFETRDEGDNAEANKQMRDLRRIVKDSGAAIVALSHMGKDPSAKGVYKLRGASARPAAADVVLNVEPYSDDVICLEVVKNRWVGGNVKLFLRKAGEDAFEVAEVSGEDTATMDKQIREFIRSVVPHQPTTIRTKEILSSAEQKGFSVGTVEKVLSRMTQIGADGLKRVKQGVYTRIPQGVEAPDSSFRPPRSIGKSDSEEVEKDTDGQCQILDL